MADLKSSLQALTDTLVAKKMTIATAESCTGGLIAGFLTELPGSSAWFERGFVTYSNAAKEEMLGVDKALIEQHGAVSALVAEAMALGALNHSAANVALSVTGIAGPLGGSLKKPVGLVYFGFAIRPHLVTSDACYFTDIGRQAIRLHACQYALQGILAFLRTQ